MSEIHIGSKKKLRQTIAKLNREGFKHNLKFSMEIPRHNGITVILDNDKKEAIA